MRSRYNEGYTDFKRLHANTQFVGSMTRSPDGTSGTAVPSNTPNNRQYMDPSSFVFNVVLWRSEPKLAKGWRSFFLIEFFHFIEFPIILFFSSFLFFSVCCYRDEENFILLCIGELNAVEICYRKKRIWWMNNNIDEYGYMNYVLPNT